jgi:hypothetical protein
MKQLSKLFKGDKKRDEGSSPGNTPPTSPDKPVSSGDPNMRTSVRQKTMEYEGTLDQLAQVPDDEEWEKRDLDGVFRQMLVIMIFVFR